MRKSTKLATDSVAIAIEAHLREMEAEGHATLIVEETGASRILTFGLISAHGESYDVALLRLAGALLEDERHGARFLARLRTTPGLSTP